MKRCISGIVVIALFILSFITAAFANEQMVKASLMKAPLSFIKNQGQKDPSTIYYEQGRSHVTTFTKEGIILALPRLTKIKEKHDSPEVVTLTPLTSSSFSIEALDKKEGRVNYILGNDPTNWKINIPTYGAILYKNVYPGIDMKFYGTNNQLEYDIIVSPQADPSKVLLSYQGVKKLSLSPTGDLEISLGEGSLIQKKPHVYQTISGARKEIEGRFIVAGNTYGFEVAPYDKGYPLIIDPVLVYSTYLGGNDYDDVWAIAIDGSGNVYVAGRTETTNFPTTLNPFQGSNAGSLDGFVAKLNPAGNELVYSTYLGGNHADAVTGIAIDGSGSAYVAGHTWSTNFPTTLNPFQGSNAGEGDAFIAKLNPAGNELVYSTYLGGNADDAAYAIAIDGSGNAYVAGRTETTNFPTLNPFQGSNAGSLDGFVAKLNPAGTHWSTPPTWGEMLMTMPMPLPLTPRQCLCRRRVESTNFPTTLNPFQGTNAGSRRRLYCQA